MESSYFIPWRDDTRLINYAMIHIINKFDLKLDERYKSKYNGLSYYFIKKNTNRYFRKHLGFTYRYVKDGTMVTITDHKKHMLFKLQYGI